MLHRFLSAILEMGHASEFETYCENLQRPGLAGAPTVDEARKDYQAALRSITQTLAG